MKKQCFGFVSITLAFLLAFVGCASNSPSAVSVPPSAPSANTTKASETASNTSKVYFLTGDGEADITADYSSAAQSLRDNHFKVDTLDILAAQKIPGDATAIIIAGSKKEIGSKELAIIKGYLDDGGSVLLLLNPNPGTDVKKLISPWGINVLEGTVVDPTSSLSPSVTSPVVPLARNFFGLKSIYFPSATAFSPQPEYQLQVLPSPGNDAPVHFVWSSNSSDLEMFSLARTSLDSWLNKNLDQSRPPVFDSSTDIKGPFDLGFFIVKTPRLVNGEAITSVPLARLVLIGDSDFASNQNFTNGDNSSFFLNVIKVLTSGKQ